MEPYEYHVIFADILGFAALVDQHDAAASEVRRKFLASKSTVFHPPDSPLDRCFSDFHSVVDAFVVRTHDSVRTSVVFSDSLFVSVEKLQHSVALARSLMKG